MTGLLRQINRSRGGLPKGPVAGAVMLGTLGIDGDRHTNLRRHGGPAKAVLMIAAEVVDHLVANGFPLFYGALGENLTVSGFDPHLWRSGQRYRIGSDALIELTTLREPCSNLDIYGLTLGQRLYDLQCKKGDITSPHWAHGGFYAKVVREGLIAAGLPILLDSELA
jgi:MOSC domain-containing protein YiiM